MPAFTEIPIKDLPLYSYDYDADFPPAGLALKKSIAESDGLLFISPEYNRSIPGALKNAIDWGSRPWGTNSFARKPTGIIGASVGAIGTAVMQSSMRSVLSFLDAPQLNSPEAYINFKPSVFGGRRHRQGRVDRRFPHPLHARVRGIRPARPGRQRRGTYRRPGPRREGRKVTADLTYRMPQFLL